MMATARFWIISLSSLGVVGVTTFQLMQEDGAGSLLTSSIVAVYATYLCYSSVSSNPVESCNPMYSTSDDWISITVGLSFAFASMSWVTFRAPNAVYAVFGIFKVSCGSTRRAIDRSID